MAPEPMRQLEDGENLEKRVSVYKDIVVTGVRDVPDSAAICTAAISGRTLSKEESARLVRKIDFNLMPLLCIVYLVQFLDKVSLSYASIMGIRQDTNLDLSQYSWLGSIFYIGYLVGEWPTNYALQRLPLAKWSSANIFMWGGILACTAACTEFKGLMVVRFLLGLCEACITPSFSLVTAQWYLKKEQGVRRGIWFSFNAMAMVVGAVMAWGLAKTGIEGGFAIAAWRVMFLLLGSITMALGVILLIFLPDSPLNARFLNKEERLLAVERIRSNQSGIGNKAWKLYQFKEALADPLTWLYCLASITLNIPNGGITNFFSIIITDMGYDPITSLLYGAPAGAVVMAGVLSVMFLGDFTRMRILCGCVGSLVGLMGVLLLWQLPMENQTGRLIGYYFVAVIIGGFTTVLSLISSNVAGSTKKSTVTALFMISYAVGNVIGPQTFLDKDAPRYDTALIVFTACIIVAVLTMLAIWSVNVRRNRANEAIRNAPGYVALQNQEFLDLTDRENPAFHYTC
ncbi:putative MFS allantoate transporter, partial [Leucosporidium creatinivorum]